MRWVVVTMIAGALLLGNESAALAKKVPCKKIKEAIAEGKTAEQVAAQLGARLQRVEKCVAGKQKKPGQAPGAAPADEEDEEE